MEQTTFGPPFLGPSSCEASSADPEEGCSVALEAAEESAVPVPDPNDHLTRAAYVQVTS